MTKQLTRRELYELVWTKPRTELAKQFNVSDVAVGKWCRELNVPAPPAGYWAHIAAGGKTNKKFVRPPLTFSVAERIKDDQVLFAASIPEFDPTRFEQPAPTLVLPTETLSETLARYEQLIRTVPIPKQSRVEHPIVQKLVAEDQRLAAKSTSFSWEQPKYQSVRGQQLLSGLNRLFWWWTDIGFKPSASGTRHIRLYVSDGGHGDSFQITNEDPRVAAGRNARERDAPAFHLRFDIDSRYTRQEGKPILVFAVFDSEALVAMTMKFIERREHGFREWVRREHEHKTWQRQQAIEKDRAAKETARVRHEAETKELLELRNRLIDEAIDGMRRADGIRALVEIVQARSESDQRCQTTFAAWKNWALGEADMLDIRTRSTSSVEEWLAAFRLPTAGNENT
jgi:hypothetical protein